MWTSTEFASTVEEVWKRIGVVRTHEGIGRRNNALFLDGARKLGLQSEWMDRNAPACVGCGVCYLGCPSGGKASVDKSILPEALNHGARILTRVQVNRVLFEGTRAVGVECSILDADSDAAVGTLSIQANIVVLAASALATPMILQRSGVTSPHLGKHLAIHPGVPVFGQFDEPVTMWNGVPQGAWAHDPVEENALLEVANTGPAELFSMFGRAGDTSMLQTFKHLSLAGAMIRDSGDGTVDVDVDDDGRMRPKLTVSLTDRDVLAFRNGARTLVKLWFAAGAKRVAVGVDDVAFHDTEASAMRVVDGFTAPTQLAQPYGSHPHGTCRMGQREGAHAGVADITGRVHGTDNVYVMDGSLFPTTLGVNPQVTIMATAIFLARQLLAR
jgi:choline dehydrogenase-like flavoprotein